MAAEDVAQQVLATVGLWWPDADEDRLRAAAAAWDRMAARLDAAVPAGRGVVAGAGTWSGDAAAAFREAWARHEGALTTDAAGCRQVAGGLRAYADAVADAKRRVTEIAVTVGATLVVGTALAVVTFGVAEAAAAGVSAGLVAAAAAIGVELSSTVAAITAGALTGVVFGAAEGVAVDAMVAQPIRVEGFGDGGYSVGELRDSAVWGGAGGAVVAGAGGAMAVRPLVRTAAGDLSGLRAPGGMMRAALDPPNWGPQSQRWKPGVHEVSPQHTFQVHERRTADLLAAEGRSVHARSEINVEGVPNPDALVRSSRDDPGRYTEFKAPSSTRSTAVRREILDAGKQLASYGGGDVIVDGRAVGLTREVAEEGVARAIGQARVHGQSLPTRIRVLLADGTEVTGP